MTPSSVYSCKKWSTVLGAFLTLCPLGFTWYWGNLSLYVISYVIKYLPDTSGAESPVAISLVPLGFCLGIFMSALMSKFVGKRPAVIFGTLVFSAGWLGGYYAIKKSLMAMNVVLGLTLSFGSFIVYGTVTLYAVEWATDDVGMVTTIVQSGLLFGTIIMNQFITLYVNPDNFVPDQQQGPSVFFSQKEVVDNVPSLILMLMIITLAVNFVGIILLRENPQLKMTKDCENPTTKMANVTAKSEGQASSVRNSDAVAKEEARQTKEDAPLTPDKLQSTDLTPKQVIRSLTLYYYWFLFVLGELPFILMCNYYKAYGELYIKDDHFLTNVATVLLLVLTISRILLGVMLDRCGLKTTLLIYFSGCAISGFLFYFSPMINRWCYAVMTLVYGCFSSTLFTVFSVAALKSFGKRYFLFNFGLMLLPTIVTSAVFPPLIRCILIHMGWIYVFSLTACFSLVGILAIIFLCPKIENKKIDHGS